MRFLMRKLRARLQEILEEITMLFLQINTRKRTKAGTYNKEKYRKDYDMGLERIRSNLEV